MKMNRRKINQRSTIQMKCWNYICPEKLVRSCPNAKKEEKHPIPYKLTAFHSGLTWVLILPMWISAAAGDVPTGWTFGLVLCAVDEAFVIKKTTPDVMTEGKWGFERWFILSTGQTVRRTGNGRRSLVRSSSAAASRVNARESCDQLNSSSLSGSDSLIRVIRRLLPQCIISCLRVLCSPHSR